MEKLEKFLEDKITALKRFAIKDNPESNYINNGFYTNKYVYINDKDLSLIPSERKVLNKDYTKILNVYELENKFLNSFKGRKASVVTMSKSDFNKFNKEMKRFKFQQIKIRDGAFALYDETGRSKWFMKGKTDLLKGFILDFDYKLFIDILNYVEAVNPMEVTFYTDKTYLKVKVTGKAEIYARGVILETKTLEQKTLA